MNRQADLLDAAAVFIVPPWPQSTWLSDSIFGKSSNMCPQTRTNAAGTIAAICSRQASRLGPRQHFWFEPKICLPMAKCDRLKNRSSHACPCSGHVVQAIGGSPVADSSRNPTAEILGVVEEPRTWRERFRFPALCDRPAPSAQCGCVAGQAQYRRTLAAIKHFRGQLPQHHGTSASASN
jgi:hypothetical protein